jgi:hypothetical protein
VSVHAQIPARVTRTSPAAAHAGRLAGPLQVRWLLGGLAFAFGLPFVFADLVGLQRDVYYAIYVVAVFALFATWARQTQQPLRAFLTRRWKWALLLGVVTGGLLTLIVLHQPATAHPHGWAFVGAILWRGVAYGAADGLLLSAFPVLAVFSLFAVKPLRERTRKAVVGIGAFALAVSLLFTAVYHLGYPDFRNSKVKSPMIGDVIWSTPTLLTLNPLGAPIAHIVLHVDAVVHSSNTDLFLPPHR